MPIPTKTSFTMSSKPKDLKEKEKEHATFLAKKIFSDPKPDSNKIIRVHAIRSVASSPLAQIGVVDHAGLSESSRKWLSETECSTNADSGFFSKLAPTKESRMYNDASVPDSDFAADKPIQMK
jgi:hypothetical protein